MNKIFMVVLFCAVGIMALDDVTRPFSFSARDTMKASKFEANFDTIYHAINKLNDTLDASFHRGADSTWVKITVDSLSVLTNISGNPIIDSIQGVDVISGNPAIDSATGPLILTGKLTCDTMTASWYTFDKDTQFYCSLYDGASNLAVVLGYARKFMNSGYASITIGADIVNVSIAGTNDVELRIPTIFRPNTAQYHPIFIKDNGTQMVGAFVILADGHPKIRKNATDLLTASSSNTNIYMASFTYMVGY